MNIISKSKKIAHHQSKGKGEEKKKNQMNKETPEEQIKTIYDLVNFTSVQHIFEQS